ncbi:MAG: DUF4097 family beta strand repeat-containing protein [Gemmatimonadaceae bacterium]
MSMPRTWIRAGIAASLVVTSSFIPVRVYAQDGYTSPRNADVDASGARVIQIEAHAGGLRVEGRAGLSEVRIRGTARASARDMLDDIKLIAERRGNAVFIKADIPEDRSVRNWVNGNGHYRGLDLVIEVPMAISLDVGDGSGEASFVNVGALELSDGSGEIEIRGARGDVSVNDGSGTIDIDGVQGNLKIHDGSGEIRARNVTGDVIVDTDGSGSINVSGVGGTMRVGNDGSGNIDVDRVAGNFVVDSDGGGSIRYATVKGSVDIPDQKRDRRSRGR